MSAPTVDLRAIDAEVATRVMGLRAENYPAGPFYRGPFRGDDFSLLPVPHYTTSHDAMALVLAELRRRGWCVMLQLEPEGMPGAHCLAEAWDRALPDERTQRADCKADAETAPLCIARLALACVEATA